MKNNNSAVIRRLIKSSLRVSKKRNFFVTTAIALATLLIASVFSIGMSILESLRMQQIRLMGTTAHASITHATEAQIERLKQLDYVDNVGLGSSVALVERTPEMGDMVLTLHYSDRTEWEKLRAPAFADVTGSYPQEENEIMVPAWVLERLGIDNPSVGMEIPLTYYPYGGSSGGGGKGGDSGRSGDIAEPFSDGNSPNGGDAVDSGGSGRNWRSTEPFSDGDSGNSGDAADSGGSGRSGDSAAPFNDGDSGNGGDAADSGSSAKSVGIAEPVSDGIVRPVSEVFRLSGWFTSYVHIRSGNIDSIFVSEALSKRYGKTVENNGAATVLFDDSSRVLEYCERLERDLALSETQRVKAVPAYEADPGTTRTSLIALSTVSAFLILTGYLLIYNVLYISVSRDVRFYGLLKTLGTTPKQIRYIVLGQIMRLCAIGIPVGGAAALLLSLVVVPAVLSRLGGVATGSVISFSPLIYFGPGLLALLTALLGAIKPAQRAGVISPIEAQKFTGLPLSQGRVHTSAHGKPYRMAWRNIFRDRKRAIIVLLSLFLGMTTFIAVTTLVASMDTDNYVASYIDSDFVLRNNTAIAGYGPKQKFDAAFIDAIRSLPGLESMRITTQQWMRLGYSPDSFGEYVADYAKRNNLRSLAEEDIRDNFIGIIAGVDRESVEKLNAAVDSSVDIDDNRTDGAGNRIGVAGNRISVAHGRVDGAIGTIDVDAKESAAASRRL